MRDRAVFSIETVDGTFTHSSRNAIARIHQPSSLPVAAYASLQGAGAEMPESLCGISPEIKPFGAHRDRVDFLLVMKRRLGAPPQDQFCQP